MASENDTPVDLYIAAYTDPDAAQGDWDAIKEMAKQKTITVDGLVLISRGMDGKIDVKDNFHTVGHGAAWGAGAGLLIGLIFPPALLASGLVGAAAGAGIGGLVSHSEKSEIKDEVQVLALAPEIIVTREGSAERVCKYPGMVHAPPCHGQGRIVELPGELLDEPGLAMLEAAETLYNLVYSAP